MTKKFSQKQVVLLCGDIVLITLSFYLAPVSRFQIVLDPLTVFSFSDVVAIMVYILIIYISDLYNFEEKVDKDRLAFEFTIAILIINIINAALFYLFHLSSYGSWIILISSLLALTLLLLWRLVFIYFTGVTKIPLRILILGSGTTGKALYADIKASDNYKVIGFADDDEAKQGLIVDDLPILGKCANLCDLIEKYKINKVIVAIHGSIGIAVFHELAQAKFNGVTVYEIPTFYEKFARKIPVLHTSSMWLGYADICGIKKSVYNQKLKKLQDKAIALIYLIIGLPLLILIAVAIKLDSPGPVFCIQKRIGWHGQSFHLVKFRTMMVGLENHREFAGQKKDPRITRIGKFLRVYRLDEVPQLWNILRGEMSFVGPRALMEEEVNEFTPQIPYFSFRHCIRPGITGWAQINYRHGATGQDGLAKLEYDLYYIKNGSFLLDVRIMLKTVWVVLTRLGAR